MQRDDRDGRRTPGSMLSEPPLIDRLLWREGIQPDTLISNDPGLIARTFGTLYLIGGGLGFGLLLIGERTENPGIGVALSGSALMLGIVCFVVYRRLPIAFFASMVTLGSVMIAAAAAAAPEGAEGVYGFFYVWVVFMSFLFFRPAVATAQTAFAAVAYGAVLIATDAPFTGDLLITAAATLVATGAIMGLLVSRMEHLAAGFVTEAHTDPVTAIANRRDFDERFELEVGRARLSRTPMSLLICDLDRFKAVNDAMGHEEGDMALRRAASAIAAAVRSMDAVARLGGEEFGVIIPNAGRDEAVRVADRVRSAVAAEFEAYPVQLTASCGLACTSEMRAGKEALFRAADAALYAAKRAGRDCTVAFDGRVEAAAPR